MAVGTKPRTQRDEERDARLLHRHETRRPLPEEAPVLHDDREDRAELDDDVERVGPLPLQAEQAAHEDEVPGRRDRQVLGDAFDDAEDRRVERVHCALETPRIAELHTRGGADQNAKSAGPAHG